MIKTYFLAKILHKLQIPSFKCCNIDKTSRVSSGCALTKVKMGRYTYTGNCTHITDAEIGKFCSIGDYCGIGGGIHPMTTVSTSPVFLQGKNIMRKNLASIAYSQSITVKIENDVWVGDGVYIKPGIKIGSGAVIGAHSVVTHDVKPFTIVAGVPAKEIRKRFDEDTIQKLLELKWWDWPDEKIQKYGSFFNDPSKLIMEINKTKG